MNTWIVIGSSPSVVDALPKAMALYPSAITITTNAGILLIRPDYYFLSDMNACRQYGAKSKEIQATGSKVITLAKNERALKSRGVDHADILLEIVRGQIGYTKGYYADCQLSGLFCLQFALENNATRIVSVGHEGYTKNEEPYYWYEPENIIERRKRQLHTANILQPFWQAAVSGNPSVTFEIYGKLNYTLTGDNVRFIDENQDASRLAEAEVRPGG